MVKEFIIFIVSFVMVFLPSAFVVNAFYTAMCVCWQSYVPWITPWLLASIIPVSQMISLWGTRWQMKWQKRRWLIFALVFMFLTVSVITYIKIMVDIGWSQHTGL